MADLRELDQDERNAILHRMVEGLHALIFGIYTIGSGDYALKALGDGGSIHEYVHGMLTLLPERCYEQVKTSDMDTQALARKEFAHALDNSSGPVMGAALWPLLDRLAEAQRESDRLGGGSGSMSRVLSARLAVLALMNHSDGVAVLEEADRRGETRAEVLSDVDPVVLEAWKLQGHKVGAMLRDAQSAVIELREALEAFMALDKSFGTVCAKHLDEIAKANPMGRAVKLARAALAATRSAS